MLGQAIVTKEEALALSLENALNAISQATKPATALMEAAAEAKRAVVLVEEKVNFHILPL